MPVLLVSGTEDNIASYKMTEAVSGLSARAHCAIVSGGSHYMHYDNQHLLGDIAKQFLKQGKDFSFKHGLVKTTTSQTETNTSEPVSTRLDNNH